MKLKFIHITKNAGTSIENIAQEKSINWGRFDSDLKFLGNSFWHKPLQFNQNEKLKAEILDNYDLFAVVRHPYTRCISEYYCKWGGPKSRKATKHELNSYIQEKVRSVRTRESVASKKSLSNNLYGHFVPQFYYLYDGQGNRIVQNIIRFENLEQEFNSLMKKYEIPLVLNRHDNRNSSKFTVSDLTPDTKRLIFQVYKRDFKEFDYAQ